VRTWKDEVRDRVRDRREKRSGDLPLFADAEEAVDAAEEAAEPAAAPPPPDHLQDLEPAREPEGEVDAFLGPAPAEEMAGPPELGEPEADDLVLQPAALDEEPPAMAEVPPVERPAHPVERLTAALIDVAILGSLAAAIVYFTCRIAHVPLAGLRPAWPWL